MMSIEESLEKQRAYFAQGRTKPLEVRLEVLRKLQRWLRANDEKVMAALKADLNKAQFEAYATEVGIVLEEVRHALRHLRRWARDKRVATPITQFPSRSFIRYEPFGVALIMSPWNYPFMLTLAPLVGAIAAGNCAVVKPSAYAPKTSAVIADMAREVFDPAHVTVVEGGRRENEALLGQRFDYIFFTGSVAVGKIVMAAAAQYLTPVSLELGGKSPCIVDETADIPLAAKRIVWGKCLNAGQTCVAPDYLFVHSSVKRELVERMIQEIGTSFGEWACHNDEYPKMINEKHYARMLALARSGRTLHGGGGDAISLQIEPTLLEGVDWDSPVMREEIFGPVLPVLTFDHLDEVVAQVSAREKPLALYLFTKSKANERRILCDLSFGGGCINDTVVHLATPRMPFGGVGQSGMGGYHGQYSFETFSHKKSILKKALWLDLPMRYPPYKEAYLKLLKRL